MLGVTRQRVSALIANGDLISVRPWPGAVRIPMSAVEDWQAGVRRPAITKTAAVNYILAQGGEMPVSETLYAYITGARPEWEEDRREEWVNDMTPFAERAAVSFG